MMTFTQALGALWNLVGTFLTGTNSYVDAYAKVGETIDARATIFRDDQIAQLKEQALVNASRIKHFKEHGALPADV